MLQLCSLCQTRIHSYLLVFLAQILHPSLSNEAFSNPSFSVPSGRGDLLIPSPWPPFGTPGGEESSERTDSPWAWRFRTLRVWGVRLFSWQVFRGFTLESLVFCGLWLWFYSWLVKYLEPFTAVWSTNYNLRSLRIENHPNISICKNEDKRHNLVLLIHNVPFCIRILMFLQWIFCCFIPLGLFKVFF